MPPEDPVELALKIQVAHIHRRPAGTREAHLRERDHGGRVVDTLDVMARFDEVLRDRLSRATSGIENRVLLG